MNEIDKYDARALELIEGRRWRIFLQDNNKYHLWCDIGIPCSKCKELKFFSCFGDGIENGCYLFRNVADKWYRENKYPWLFI